LRSDASANSKKSYFHVVPLLGRFFISADLLS
jgi:hypothetical protein